MKGTGRYVLVAALAAFAGACAGNYFLKKVSYHALRMIVAVMLILLGAGLAAGLI
ncbi:MAG: hypothetical protein ACYC5N_03695 [Endomicrobiales bacterium]